MNLALVFIALLSIPVAGLGPAVWFLRRPGTISAVELMVVSWLLGVSVLSLALACGGIFLRGLALQMTVATGCVLSGYIALRLWRLGGNKISWPKLSCKMEWVLCAVLLLEFAVVAWIQCRTALGWDGLFCWEVKARYAFLNGGSIPPEYFSDPTRVLSHPGYPLMLPMLETWIYLWIGDCDQFWVRFIFPVFYYASALVLYSGVAHLTGKKWAGLTAAAMPFFLPFPVAGPWNVFAGYADLPLAVFYLAAVVCFLRYQIESSRTQLTLMAVLAGMMPWIKQEGIVLWCCLMAVVLVELLRRRKLLASALVIVPGLAVWAGWKIATHILCTRPGADFLPCNFGILAGNLPRILTALRMLAGELGKVGNWSLLWVAFPIALICLGCTGRRKIAGQLFFCVAAPLLLLSCAFILSACPVYQNHISTSLPRLVLQVSPVAVLAIGLALGRSRSGAVEPEFRS